MSVVIAGVLPPFTLNLWQDVQAMLQYDFMRQALLAGTILGISTGQTQSIALISALAVLALLFIARPLLFASLDPDVAAAQGVPVRMLGLFFMVLLAVTVSEATLAVGALLVFALLLLPAAIAHQVTNRPYAALACAAGLAIAFTWLGITIGFYTGYPSSVCISLLAFVSYVAVVGSSRKRSAQMKVVVEEPF